MNWEELRKTILQAIALIGMNALAFIYDAEYVPAVLLVDATILGVEIGIHYATRGNAAHKAEAGNP